MVLERAGGLIGQGVAGEDAGAHHACGTQVAHQLAGVDVAQADDAVLGEVVVQAAFGTPVAHVRRGITHNVSGNPDAGGLRVFAVDAGIADVRERLHNDLAIVARIGERLLVSGHTGGEDDLTGRLAKGARMASPHIPVRLPKRGLHRPCHTSELRWSRTRSGSPKPPYVFRVFVPRLTAAQTHTPLGAKSHPAGGAVGKVPT